MPQLVDHATYSERPAAKRGRALRANEAQIATWQAFVRAFSAASDVQRRALEGSKLDMSEYDVLVTLGAGPPEGMRPVDLAERTLLTKSGMTRLLQRLETRRLVARHACPVDKRGQFIAMTPAGRHLLRRAAPSLLRSLGSLLAPLSTDDLAAFQRAAQRITEAATAHSA
jgi:DNA-binding MarR family transcriptional regulator